jgi:hypothetical protein
MLKMLKKLNVKFTPPQEERFLRHAMSQRNICAERAAILEAINKCQLF